MYWIINEVILFKDNSVGSEPDTDLLEQWGEFVPEIKTVSDILIDSGSVWEALSFLNNNNFLLFRSPPTCLIRTSSCWRSGRVTGLPSHLSRYVIFKMRRFDGCGELQL